MLFCRKRHFVYKFMHGKHWWAHLQVVLKLTSYWFESSDLKKIHTNFKLSLFFWNQQNVFSIKEISKKFNIIAGVVFNVSQRLKMSTKKTVQMSFIVNGLESVIIWSDYIGVAVWVELSKHIRFQCNQWSISFGKQSLRQVLKKTNF